MRKSTMVWALAALSVAGCSSPTHAPSKATAVSSSSSAASSAASSSSRAPATAQDTAPVGKAGTPRGGGVSLGGLKRTDSAAVASAAVRGANIVDLLLDHSPVDAQRRVSSLMSPDLAKVLAQPLAAQSAVGAGWPGWEELRSRQGWSSADAMNIGESGDGDHGNTSVQRFMVTVTGHDAHGWSSQLSQDPWLVKLSRTSAGAPWQVTGMQRLAVS